MTYRPGLIGSYVPTTDIFDLDDIKELVVQLREVVNDIALVLNTKDTGIYPQVEFINGQLWFPPSTPLSGKTPGVQRQVFRKVIDFGVLPNNATKTVAHGITTNQNFSFTRIYGVATNPGATSVTRAIPIPYINVVTPTDSVQLNVGPTNVRITTTSANYINYTKTYVILEWITE